MDELKLDQLPYLCLKRIFEHLSLRDLIRARAVSKLFKDYAEKTRVTELIVSDHQVPCRRCDRTPTCSRWHSTDAPMNFEFAIGWSALLFVKQTFKLDQKLKSLHVHLKDADFDTELLNAFEQLVHLELRIRSRHGQRDKPITLVFPKLKVLSVWREGNYGDFDRYILKTPNLEVLAACDRSYIIELDCSETVKQLTLRTWKFFGDHPISLSNLKNLKELALELDLDYLDYLSHDEEDEVEEMRVFLVNLIRQRDTQEREEPKFYLNGVPLIDSANQLKDRASVSNQDAFWFQNYKRIRGSEFGVNRVNFNQLMETGVELSGEFFVKFPAIRCVHSTELVDRDAFEAFLKKLSALRELYLTNTSLDQAFMDRLPKINSRLTSLIINGSSNLVANFDFILQFGQLREFRTDRHIRLELSAKAFRQLNELECFGFLETENSLKFVNISRCSTIKSNYCVKFWSIPSDDEIDKGEYVEVGFKTEKPASLKWAELVAIFDQRRTTG